MDPEELAFAKKMYDSVINELETKFPDQMNGFQRQEFVETHFEGYLYAQLAELQKVAKLIRVF